MDFKPITKVKKYVSKPFFQACDCVWVLVWILPEFSTTGGPYWVQITTFIFSF